MTKPRIAGFLATTAILFIISNARAQYNKNDLLINVGVSSGYGYPSGLPETDNSGSVPAINLDIEHSLNQLFSLGIYAAYTYSFFKFQHPQVGYKDVWKGWDIGIRGTFHCSPLFTDNKKTDLYLAAFSGYTSRSLVYDKSNIYRDSLNYRVNALSIGPILGFRYFLTKRFGLYGEAGFSRKFFAGGGISFTIKSKSKSSK